MAHPVLTKLCTLFLGKRVPFTVDEVIDQYYRVVPWIFATTKIQDCVNWLSCKIAGVPISPYSKENIGDVARDTFGDATLKDFDGPCIAAAVARKFDSLDKKYSGSGLEIFDTKSFMSYKVADVLQATSNAPIYFE